jgi:hypothetical protein
LGENRVAGRDVVGKYEEKKSIGKPIIKRKNIKTGVKEIGLEDVD